jgi:mRNA interferase MazF
VVKPRRSPRAYIPDRGDAIWLTFDPHAGHEQSGKRPALVLSPRDYNAKVGLALVCPITRQAKGYPFEVPLPTGTSLSGAILADQVKSLDWHTRKAQRIGRLPAPTVEQVILRIELLLRG